MRFLTSKVMVGVCHSVDHLHLIDVRSSDFVGHMGVVRTGLLHGGNITLGTYFTMTTIQTNSPQNFHSIKTFSKLLKVLIEF